MADSRRRRPAIVCGLRQENIAISVPEFGLPRFLPEVFLVSCLDLAIARLQITALLKNSSFQEENEWRLVLPRLMDSPTPMKNPPQFRIGRTTLPYLAHPLPLALVDIILGPGSDENSVFAAQRFLNVQGFDLNHGYQRFLTGLHKTF